MALRAWTTSAVALFAFSLVHLSGWIGTDVGAGVDRDVFGWR